MIKLDGGREFMAGGSGSTRQDPRRFAGFDGGNDLLIARTPVSGMAHRLSAVACRCAGSHRARLSVSIACRRSCGLR
jgi:hypothetical protein